MQRQYPCDCLSLGIERVSTVEHIPVARVDVMTRNPIHALLLESQFGAQAFQFRHGAGTLHAFSRLPAVAAREWFESQGIAFILEKDGLRPEGPETWIPGGHC